MKRSAEIIIAVLFCMPLRAESYPSEWTRFTLGGFIYDIQSDYNTEKNNYADFLESLSNITRVNVAKQIKVQIKDVAKKDVYVIDGHTRIQYGASTVFATDEEFVLLQTKTYYDNNTHHGYAISYINIEDARNYYYNKIRDVNNYVQTQVHNADSLMSSKKFLKAQGELKKAKNEIENSCDASNMLSIFGSREENTNVLLAQRNELIQLIERKTSDLSITTTSIFMQCSGEIFDWSCSEITDVIKDRLSKLSCTFVDSPSQADWIIHLNTNAELDQKRKNSDSYFVKIEVTGTIYDVRYKRTYNIYDDEHDSSFKSSGDYKIAANKILGRGSLAESISNKIIERLISL